MLKNKILMKKIFLLYTVLFLLSSAFISCLALVPHPKSSAEMDNRYKDPIEQQNIERQLKTENDREYWKTMKNYNYDIYKR